MGKPLILVTMGTNGYPFHRLGEYLVKQSLYDSNNVQWLVQTGGFDMPPPACGKVEKMITRDDMVSLVQRASLIISHCGIGSLHLMLQYKKQTIFAPRVAQYGEFSDDHQLQIANEIHNSRMSVILPDDEFPILNEEEIKAYPICKEPVDITNYVLADRVKEALLN